MKAETTNPLKRINNASMRRIVVPTEMLQAGYRVDMVALHEEGRLIITWQDPKHKKPSR